MQQTKLVCEDLLNRKAEKPVAERWGENWTLGSRVLVFGLLFFKYNIFFKYTIIYLCIRNSAEKGRLITDVGRR